MSRKPERVGQQYQLIIQCLNHLDTLQRDQIRRQSLKSASRNFIKTGKRQQLCILTQDQQSFVVMLIDAYASYKQAYQEAKQYKQLQPVDDPKFQIAKQLLSMQENLKIKSIALTTEEMHTKYMLKLLQLKKKYNLKKQFLTLWAALAKQKLKTLQNKRLAQKNIRIFTKQLSILGSQLQKSSGNEQKSQTQEKPIISKKHKLDKNKITLMQKYLQGRNVKYNKQKCKQVPESLLSKLQDFMKRTIQKIIDIANLINKNDNKFGNQLGYFSPSKKRINAQGMFYVCPSIKVCKLSYRHKLDIYTTLRKYQIQTQDKLKKALQKGIQKKQKNQYKSVEDYLLKPRHFEFQLIQILNQRTNLKQNKNKNAPNTLMIKSQHVIYYIENHRYLKNSLLLFNSYNYC